MAESIARAVAREEAPDASPEMRAFWAFFGLVAAGGPLAAVLLAAARWDAITAMPPGQALVAGLLAVIAASSSRFRFSIGHQVYASVSTAAVVAMFILLPLPLPGLLVPVAKWAAERSRGKDRRTDPCELAFNVGQSAWCAVAGAMAFGATRQVMSEVPAWLGDPVLLIAAAVGFLAYHLVNTGLVAGIAGLQLNYDPLRLWASSLRVNPLADITMVLVAFAGALLIDDHPLALAALFLPLALVQRALRASVQLRADTHSALEALVDVVELRDPYTAGHSRRVATMARALALRLGCTPEEADHLESAGRVHDIGKVAIDPYVLTKPGKLDPAEWAEIRRHPELGADVIARFAAYGDGHRLVRHHHEAWDGSGYPDGLAGDMIPIGARIMAVADTFDALTSDRPYRARMDLDRALSILREGAGRQWDAAVVDALLAHLAATRAEVEPIPPAEALVSTRRTPVAA